MSSCHLYRTLIGVEARPIRTPRRHPRPQWPLWLQFVALMKEFNCSPGGHRLSLLPNLTQRTPKMNATCWKTNEKLKALDLGRFDIRVECNTYLRLSEIFPIDLIYASRYPWPDCIDFIEVCINESCVVSSSALAFGQYHYCQYFRSKNFSLIELVFLNFADLLDSSTL